MALSAQIEWALRTYARFARSERGAFRLVRLLRRGIPHSQWRRGFTTPDGLTFDLDLAIYPDCLMAYGLYELSTARLIKRLLQPGDHFVDGGANVGYFSLMAAQRVGKHGVVDAFEPQPDNRARLEANIERDGLGDRVHVHAEALSIDSGKATIHMSTDGGRNHGCASLFEPPSPTQSRATPEATTVTHEVTTARLDSVLNERLGQPVKLIKLDVEGAEPLAIAGMSNILGRLKPPDLIVEFNRASAAEADFAPREWIDRLLAAQPNYKLFVIGRRLRQIEPNKATLDTLGQVNLFVTTGSDTP